MSGQLTESRFDYLIEHIDSLSDSEKAELLIEVNPKVWTKNLIKMLGSEFGTQPDSFLLV